MHSIDVVNAPRKKGGKKKGKNVAGKKKKSNKKKSGAKRKSNPRKSRGKKKGGRRRKSNPTMRNLGIFPNMKKVLYMLFGMAFAAHGVMRFAGGTSQTQYSQTAGAQWGWNQALVAILSAWFGSKLAKKMFGAEAAGYFYLGGFMLVGMKMFWFHVLRAFPQGASYFGQVPGGTVRYDENGNVLMAQNGQWVTMQGYDGLAEATPLGGELAPATPLGQGVDADPWLNGADSDPWLNGYGHIMQAGAAGSPAADWGARNWRGSSDPYIAAYS